MNNIYPNLVAGAAGLTGLDAAATDFDTANAFDFAINGKAYSKAAVVAGTTPTTDGNTGEAITLEAGKAFIVVWAVDAAGAVTCYQGPVSAMANDVIVEAMQFPRVPDSVAAFAYSIHSGTAALAADFEFGTDNWDTAETTHTPVDCLYLPNRPQVD